MANEAQLPVSTGITYLFLAILVLMIVSLAFEEKLHAKKSLIVGVFAILCIALGTFLKIIPLGNVVLPGGHSVVMPVYITSVDWAVIAIILGSSLFVDVTSRSGLFTWIALKLTKASVGDPLKLLWYYGIMTIIFSAVLNNVTAMIIVGSLSAVSLNKLGQKKLLLGFLLTEGLLTNIGGLLTLISSVPNIIVGTAAKISFVEFFIKAGPFVALATIATILLSAKIFSIKALANDHERQQAQKQIESFDERDGIESTGFFWFSSVMLVLFIVSIASASALPKVLGMGFVALAFAAIMLIRFKSRVDEFYRTLDWDLIGFFIALFIVIGVLEHAKVLDFIGEGLTLLIGEGKNMPGTAGLLVASAAASSVTDNIPLAAMLAKILVDGPQVQENAALWWSVVFGANLGGNITPIGSASTLVAVTIIHKHKLAMSFIDFIKKASIFALMQLSLAVAYVLFVLY